MVCCLLLYECLKCLSRFIPKLLEMDLYAVYYEFILEILRV